MNSDLLEILYEALHSELGLVVEAVDGSAEELRAKLYRVRAEHEALSLVSISISPTQPSTHLFLIRKPDGAAKAHPEPAEG